MSQPWHWPSPVQHLPRVSWLVWLTTGISSCLEWTWTDGHGRGPGLCPVHHFLVTLPAPAQLVKNTRYTDVTFSRRTIWPYALYLEGRIACDCMSYETLCPDTPSDSVRVDRTGWGSVLVPGKREELSALWRVAHSGALTGRRAQYQVNTITYHTHHVTRHHTTTYITTITKMRKLVPWAAMVAAIILLTHVEGKVKVTVRGFPMPMTRRNETC